MADIQLSLMKIPAWQMVYAPRQVNRIAHCLAQQAVKGNLVGDWMNDPPESIQVLLEAECADLVFDIG